MLQNRPGANPTAIGGDQGHPCFAPRQLPQSLLPTAFVQVLGGQVDHRQPSSHCRHKNVVLREIAAVGVDHRGALSHTIRDDTIARLGDNSVRRRNQFDDDVFLYYAGLFAHYPRCAQSLEIMLADFFEQPTAVRQFQGQWLRLGPDDLSALPLTRIPAGLNTQLGTNVVIGERVWNIESKFRIRLGPLNYRDFRRFLPSADRLCSLSHLTRNYVGPQFDFDVQLILKAREVPCCRLGGDGTDPSRLGWNTWVRSGEFEHDVDDAIFPEKA